VFISLLHSIVVNGVTTKGARQKVLEILDQLSSGWQYFSQICSFNKILSGDFIAARKEWS
jgi:hypothetical protein